MEMASKDPPLIIAKKTRLLGFGMVMPTPEPEPRYHSKDKPELTVPPSWHGSRPSPIHPPLSTPVSHQTSRSLDLKRAYLL
jgi:hypothetical protein